MNSLVKSNRQLLAMLKERISQLSDKEQAPADLAKIPSRGQAFFYRSEATFEGPAFQSANDPSVRSLVRVQQDAAFVATDLHIVGIFWQEPFRENLESIDGLSELTLLRFIAASSGRNLSIATNEQLDVQLTPPFFDFGVPFHALTPLGGAYQNGAAANYAFDYHYKLPAEYLLPRGAIVEGSCQISASGTPGALVDGNPYQRIGVDFVLGGYKVFGA